MQAMRSIRQDRWLAYLVIGLLAYLLLLQGLVSAHARSAMAADDSRQGFVICAPSGADNSQVQHPLSDLAHECCSSLCQLACSVGPADLPADEIATPSRVELDLDPQLHVARANITGISGLASDARAPPSFS